MVDRRRLLLIGLLCILVLAVYGGTYTYGFANLDDDAYVSQNPMVLRGLTLDGVRWAFTTGQEGHWSPLTWLSLMLDVQLFGASPGALHIVNVVLHLANALLLFALLARMTGAVWPSWTVAAMFALHPLHVESVVWISERKDVLSTLFWFLTLAAYIRYVGRHSVGWYLLTVALFAAGLMAKSMLVTLPFVLLLLDVWPLQRVRLAEQATDSTSKPRASRRGGAKGVRRETVQRRVYKLVQEKIPLLTLTIVFSVVAYATQSYGNAVVAAERLSLGVRVSNALVAYVHYLLKTVWPTRLAIFYPYEANIPLWRPIAAALCIITISVVVLRNVRRHPYAMVGWFWYLGTLVPVIGIVQIGGQAFADRYTYVPLVGIFIMAVWTAMRATASVSPRVVAAAAATIVVLYAAAARVQVGVWRTNEELLARAIDVSPGNAVALNNLGVTLAEQGKLDAAIARFRAALQSAPQYADAYSNLGATLARRGEREEAAAQYRMALRYRPEFLEARWNLTGILLELGRPEEAINELTAIVGLDPRSARAHYRLATLLRESGRIAESIPHYTAVLQESPDAPEVHYGLGLALIQANQPEAALVPLRRAIALNADFAEAHNDLGVALMNLGRRTEAMAEFRQALALKPDLHDAMYNLDVAQQAQPQAGDR